MANVKKILIVLEGGSVFASGVVRGLIYRKYFERDGYQACFVNRMNPWLLRLIQYPSARSKWLVNGPLNKPLMFLLRILCRLSELHIIRLARQHEVAYMSKVTSYGLIKALKKTGMRLVLDFGDAMWLPGRIKLFDETLLLVDTVTTDNELTAGYVRALGLECVVIPDCPQVESFDQRRTSVAKRSDRVTIGWIGSPSTVYNLFEIWEALEQVFLKHSNVHLRLVGVGPDPELRLPPFENVHYSSVSGYSQGEMIDEVLKMDIGLFPMQDVVASRVRGVLKATIYMAGGAVVVGSPIGQSVDLIRDGVNGCLADSTEEWVNRLDRLINDSSYRKELAGNALELVRQNYTVESSFRKLIGVIDPGRRL